MQLTTVCTNKPTPQSHSCRQSQPKAERWRLVTAFSDTAAVNTSSTDHRLYRHQLDTTTLTQQAWLQLLPLLQPPAATPPPFTLHFSLVDTLPPQAIPYRRKQSLVDRQHRRQGTTILLQQAWLQLLQLLQPPSASPPPFTDVCWMLLFVHW